MFGFGSSHFLAPRSQSEHLHLFYVCCFSSTVPGFARFSCLLGQGSPQQLRAGSLAIAAFPASFLATIPSYDCSPSIALSFSLAELEQGLPLFHGDDKPSLGHVIVFLLNPVLLTLEAFGGIGHPHLLQGYPVSLAIMVLPPVPRFAF